MDGHEYLAHLAQVTALASCVEDIPVTDMLNHITHIHTIGPILDPTVYRGGMTNLDDQDRLLRALAPFVKAVQEAKVKAVAP